MKNCAICLGAGCNKCSDTGADLLAAFESLRDVETVLARRPALDVFDTPLEKVSHAIATASRVDALSAELARLKSS